MHVSFHIEPGLTVTTSQLLSHIHSHVPPLLFFVRLCILLSIFRGNLFHYEYIL